MKNRPLWVLIVMAAFFTPSSGILSGAEDIETRIVNASSRMFSPNTSREQIVDSLVDFLDITLSLTASSKYRDEIKHHIEVAKDLFKNSSIFNDKARQYAALAYRMVTEGVKYQKPSVLDEFVTPAEAQEKAVKYAKELVELACTNVNQGDKSQAAKLILELVLLIVTPVSG